MSNTQGPWKYSKVTNGYYISGTDSLYIADVHSWSGRDENEPETKANAQLIAAAPEMREVLDLLIKDNKLMNAMSREQVQALVNVYRKINGEK